MSQEIVEDVVREYTALLEQGDLTSAMPLIRQAANWADVDSQILAERIYLHEAYDHGIDYRTGFDYALLAAMNGDVQSMADLAMIYEKGFGATPDLAKAKYWKQKAIAGGWKDESEDAEKAESARESEE